jgi:hypothetical protein
MRDDAWLLFLYVLVLVTRHLRATRKSDTYARPRPHQIHCAEVSRAEMSCHGYSWVFTRDIRLEWKYQKWKTVSFFEKFSVIYHHSCVRLSDSPRASIISLNFQCTSYVSRYSNGEEVRLTNQNLYIRILSLSICFVFWSF